MKEKILIIEPDKQNYTELYGLLLQLNYTDKNIIWHTSTNNNILVNTKADVVLANFSLSANPLEAYKIIQNQLPSTPVIVLSTRQNAGIGLKAIQIGAQDNLVYGDFDVNLLRRTISHARERMQVRNELREDSRVYKDVFENSLSPMFIYDEKTLNFLAVNQATINTYGYSKEEFMSISIRDIRPKEDARIIKKIMALNSQGSYYEGGKWRHKAKNGGIFYVHIYSHAIEFEGKKARLIQAIDVHNKVIIARKNIDLNRYIEKQKRRYENILASLKNIVWSCLAETQQLIYINNAAYEVYGYTPADMLENKNIFFDSIHADDKKAFFTSLTNLFAIGKAEIEFRVSHKNGSIKYLKGSAVLQKGDYGEPDILNGFIADITEEKNLQEIIARNEHNLRALIDNTDEFIWSVDTNFALITANQSYKEFVHKLSGIVPEMGKHALWEKADRELATLWEKRYRRVFAGEKVTYINQYIINNTEIFREMRLAPMYDAQGKITGASCFSRDISEQRRQLIKIKEQNEKLKEIAWIQSHRVRGPVASILGLIHLFNNNDPTDPANKEIINCLNTATEDLDTIIKEVVNKTYDLDTDQ